MTEGSVGLLVKQYRCKRVKYKFGEKMKKDYGRHNPEGSVNERRRQESKSPKVDGDLIGEENM